MKFTASESNIKDIWDLDWEGSQDISTGIEAIVSSEFATEDPQPKVDEISELMLFGISCDGPVESEEDLIDEIIKMMMSDGDNGEEFLEYLLSSNEDQSSNCQTLLLWKNEATIKPQPRDDDMLDESEGSCNEDLLDLFLNNSHDAERKSEDTYKEIRYIFELNEDGIPYIANMDEIIPPNFMMWYDEIEMEQKKCDGNNQEEDLIDEIIKMMMSDGDNGEEFLEYLLSSNEDQSSNCQTLVLWKNEATIKPQPRDDDMLDESEGSCDEDLLDLFLNNSHDAERKSEDTYKEIRYIFELNEDGIPYIANMDEIIPPNFMMWYDEIEMEQKKCDGNNHEEELFEEIIMMMLSDGDELLEYLLSTNEDQTSNCQTLVPSKNVSSIKFQPYESIVYGSQHEEPEESSIGVQSICQSFKTSEHEQATEIQYEIKPVVKKSSILARIKMSATSLFCYFRGSFEDLKEPTSRSIFYV